MNVKNVIEMLLNVLNLYIRWFNVGFEVFIKSGKV